MVKRLKDIYILDVTTKKLQNIWQKYAKEIYLFIPWGFQWQNIVFYLFLAKNSKMGHHVMEVNTAR